MMSSKKHIKNFGDIDSKVSEIETPQEGTMTLPQNLFPGEEVTEGDTSSISLQNESFLSPKLSAVVALAGADLNCDLDARQAFLEDGGSTVSTCFRVANILHTHVHFSEAAAFYLRAMQLHSGNPTEFPSVYTLLQVRLLCLLKSGQDIADEELERLRSLHIPYANYISGIRLAWRQNNLRGALEKIGSAYDEFHTGEEADWQILQIAKRIEPSLFAPDRQEEAKRIPSALYMYWDNNPPPEIQNNFDLHSTLPGMPLKIFNKDEAQEWLYDIYGVEARNLFLQMRHPAEAADFLRLHVTQTLGGWWLDADLRVSGSQALKKMISEPAQNAFFLTDNGMVHNDFYGTVPNSEIVSDALLSVYRNCYLFPNLYIAFKTGPGPLTRALNRTAHKSLNGLRPTQTVAIYDQHDFKKIIEEFDTPYKHSLPNWQNV